MKKVLSTIALLTFLASARIARAEERDYFPENLYITSYYTVEVYNEKNKKIGFLYAGVRAKILKSAKYWLYVEYWDGRRMTLGWIRR
jgi:hypothetical protein